MTLVGSMAGRVPLALRVSRWVGTNDTETPGCDGSDSDKSEEYHTADSLPEARQLVHDRLWSKRSRKSSSSDSEPDDLGSTVIANEDSGIDGHVDRYLTDQNRKFDDLIYKNLGTVLVQQAGYVENGDRKLKEPASMTFRQSVSGAVTSTVGGLAGRMRFFRHNKSQEVAEVKEVPVETLEVFNGQFSSAANFDAFLDSLDYDTKILLLRMLRRDLGLTNDEELERLVLSENDIEKLTSMHKFETSGPVIDKIQLFVLIWIKLAFIGLKLMIPISYVIYRKFVENQLFLFNNKNFNKLLLVCIRCMRKLEHKLNDEKLQAYQYGYERTPDDKDIKFTQAQQELNDLYDEMTLNASTFFHQQLDMGERSSWTGSVFGFMLSKYLGYKNPQQPPPPNKLQISPRSLYVDPKYSKYFATPPPTATGAQTPALGSRSPPGSSSNLNSLSVMEMAQQFANEMI